MLGSTLRVKDASSRERSIILGTVTQLRVAAPQLHPPKDLRADGYWLKSTDLHGSESLIVAGTTDRGVLYGVFALLSKIARAETLHGIDEAQQPSAPIRWVNQWDNLDDRIERGWRAFHFFADATSALI
jgi:alpha-glucuronidase